MPYPFHIVDVFTDRPFGGNQLGVLTDASGLSDEQMQQIAIEFGYAESTFVLPPKDSANTAQVRIFTPGSELPFAGHPNVGTAFVLAASGAGVRNGDTVTLLFEELAGLVKMQVRMSGNQPEYAELTAPQPLSLGAEVDAARVAATFALDVSDIATASHTPRLASVGLPFLVTELTNYAALARLTTTFEAHVALLEGTGSVGVLLYTRESELPDADIRDRMFSSGHGLNEDAATGSANCALAGLLASLDDTAHGERSWRIAQGVEMGRPSRLLATVVKDAGAVRAVRIGGGCAMVARGEMNL